MRLPESHLKNLLHYWRVSLADEDLMGPSKTESVTTSFDCMAKGKLDEELVAALYRGWRESKKKEVPTSADIQNAEKSDFQKIPVTVFAKGFVRKHEHSKLTGKDTRGPFYYTFFIPALLSQAGELSCADGMAPWIGRQFLAPNEDSPEDTPIVGEITAFDDWLDKHPMPETAKWQDLIAWCEALWNGVTENKIPEDFAELDDVCIDLSDTTKNASRQICQLYDALIKEERLPPLLRRICLAREEATIVMDGLRISQLGTPRGTMNIKHGLADSQSDAVAAYTILPSGEVLAVNGPPGTGKTTLLQSIIASEVVLRAIAGGDPAVIVGTSTNNQAVTNINRSLNDALSENPATAKYSWARRWLPDVDTYGLYLPSYGKEKEEENKKFKMAWKEGNKWDGFPGIEQDKDYINSARQMWMDCYEKTFGEKPESIETGLERLRKDTKNLVAADRETQTQFENLCAIKKWWKETAGDVSPQSYISNEETRLNSIIKRAEAHLESATVDFKAVSEEKAKIFERHALEEQEAQKGASEKENHIRKLIGVKSRIYVTIAPKGFFEHLFQLLPFFQEPLKDRQTARLCGLAASDPLIGEMFKREAAGNDPIAWKRRITGLQNDASRRQEFSRNAEAKKAELRKQEEVGINRKFADAQREQDQGHENLNQARKVKDAHLYALQEKEKTLNVEIKKTKNCYDELVKLADKEAIPEVEQGRLREPNPAVKDFNWILDITSRHRAFQMAMRYWEGRWILEVESIQNDTDENKKRRTNIGKKGMEARFRRWCMLTPCLVSTLHSLPKHFRYVDGLKNGESKSVKDDNGKSIFISDYLLDFIDLLIVDEAGQVGPHIGAASFALAQKAIVVGDIFQIEPISKIPVGTDYANAANDKLQFLWKEKRQASPLLVSESPDAPLGSVMRLAQGATFAVSEGQQPEAGIFLSEHRRCRDKIIKYCNDLVYKGRLKPMGDRRDKMPPLPPIAWSHVQGEAKKVRGSLGNEREAQAIATWVAKNAEAWRRHYGKPIEEVVAIVTPFRQQSNLLRNALWRLLRHNRITVGTIHSLQGAEMPIVVFSPVYNANKARGMFFDNKPNMLNVVVSRAKDTFAVIGDMRLFHSKGATPSAILGSALFDEEINELTDIDGNVRLPQDVLVQGERIADLERHRDILRNALSTVAKGQKIVIASPWITLNAVNDDNLVSLIEGAVKGRGANVYIIVDRDLSLRDQRHKGKEAIAAVSNAGAKVSTVEKMHNKTLIIGDEEIVEGSFNWLSAARNSGSEYKRYESSWRVYGAAAATPIQSALDEFKKLGATLDGFR